jgi:hypothetical protein
MNCPKLFRDTNMLWDFVVAVVNSVQFGERSSEYFVFPSDI